MKRWAPIVALLLVSSAGAEQVSLSKFGGLNNNESSVIIDQSQAQNILNVDITPGGKSVKKRSGYGLYKALATGQALHGGYKFFDSSGNNVQVWGSSTSLYGIVGDATPTQLISSATLNSTWDCADTQGTAYCVDSNRDAFLSTNGATKTWYTTPLGTIITSLPDRLVVSGVSGSPNTLYFSQSGVFTNFSVGINVPDPFTEVISAPGSKITHIRTGCGKLLWWKDQSFGYVQGSDQFSIVPTIVSDSIGTFDNTSDVDPGGRVWFRGQDGHTWMYDCSGLQKMSIPITPEVQISGKHVANAWAQTSQSDFGAGAILFPVMISTAISPGDVTVSSFGVVENSNSQWSLGATNNLTVGTSSITLTINNSGNPQNNSFETTCGSGPCFWDVSSGVDFAQVTDALADCAGSVTGKDSTHFIYETGGQNSAQNPRIVGSVIDNASGLVLESQVTPMSGTKNCAFTTQTFTVSPSNVGKRVRLKLMSTDDWFATGDRVAQTTYSFVLGGNITYKIAWDTSGGNPSAMIDLVQGGSSTVTSGSFTSQVFDTGLTSATYQLQATWVANTSTPTFSLATSATSNGSYVAILTSTGTNAVGNRFVRYTSTITAGGSDNALSAITNVTIVARSTGSYYSAVHNAPNVTSWSSLSIDDTTNGNSSITYFSRASTNTFTTLSSTPSWVAQSKNATVSSSTGTYLQLRADFGITAATETPTLNDFTFNWFEGTSSDQAYLLYFDNAIWESVAFGAGQATNNYIFKYDLINEGWTLYDFGAGGLLVQDNSLYFGSTSSGNVLKFGSGTSDNGSSIMAFWKSKDFTGSDPWNQNQFTQVDSYWTRNQNQVSSITYTLDGQSTGTSYNVVLSSTTKSIISNMKLLPNGKNGQLFNIQVGDTSSSSQWEFMGFRMTFTPLPYRPTQ
jgi:hypothetical protein